MKIKQLPKEVYDLIAAGEVVLGPVSVVKELVENSLDAGATRITVDIRDGGLEKIRVADNGSGIDRYDTELAFAPHATSKLNSAEDLSHIETLGFRGEALASIAAVSSVIMLTKTYNEETGVCVACKGGEMAPITTAGTDSGTDVTVEHLFFNIPARKKHLSDAKAEGINIIEYLSKAAVSRPDVAFRLVSNGKLAFSTLGTGDRLAAIATVYGSKVAQNLIEISSISPEISLNGYISGTLGLRSNRKGQHFFVNGRPVKNSFIETAVGHAYREFAEPGRFPVVFLFVSVAPEKLDVNVHPAKNEISFTDPKEIADFVEKSIYDVLCSGRAIPNYRPRYDETFIINDTIKKEIETIVSTSGGKGEKVDEVDINDLLICENIINNANDDNIKHYLHSEDMVDRNTFQSFSENTDEHYSESLNIGELQFHTSLFATYILATSGDSAYIIDQHAAHERVNFERFFNDFKHGDIAKQGLLIPYMFSPPATIRDLSDHVDFYNKLGYEIDEFGENTWVARTFPAYITTEEAEAFLLESLEALSNEKSRDISHAAAERIMMRACKASVKANKSLSNEEIKALLDDLAECENPYTCPHGRPVFIKLTLSDIERLFKRV